jgi:hypothetical protein
MSVRHELSSGGPRPSAAARTRLRPADLAWIALLPFAGLVVPAIVLVAPQVGQALFADPGYHYWTPTGIRKAGVQAGYLLFVVATLAYASVIVWLARRQLAMAEPLRRALVALAQAVGATFVVVCLLPRRESEALGMTKSYFTPATLIVAAALAAAALAVVQLRGRVRLPQAARALVAGDQQRLVRAACLTVGVLATVLWVLPAVFTDRALPAAGYYLGAFFFDESSAVLNGRSPLVDMVAYATLWPYAVAVPLGVLGGSFAAFTATMAAITAIALLAVYGVLRRVVRRPLAALALYLPVLATSFYIEARIGAQRYDPGTYFGMFPLRYAGPYFLLWLTARQLEHPGQRRWALRLLFLIAGLVALNNVDFGASALAATALAVAIGQDRWDRRALGRLAVDLGIGVALALGLVTALTLARTGSLPHLELLVRYGRLFVAGGFGNVPLPEVGWHLAVTATFVAAVALAAVRVAGRAPDRLLTALLAWCAVFGLGASVYFYAYRSHPDVLVNLFSIWSLTLALLVVAAVREVQAPRRLPGLPALAATFGFGLAACSLAQAPAPWSELERISASVPSPQEQAIPPGGFRQPHVLRRLKQRTRDGEHVVLLSPVGHRVAREAGVVNVSPYTGLGQMPAREQLDETIEILRREGGSKLFVAERAPPGLDEALRRRGFVIAHHWQDGGWPEPTLLEYASTAASR